MNVCVVFGLMEPNSGEDLILDPKYVQDYNYMMDVYIDSSGTPIYGIKCSLDSETGKVNIVRNKRIIVDRFIASYNCLLNIEVKATFSTGVLYKNFEDQFEFVKYNLRDEESDISDIEYNIEDTPEESDGENSESVD